VLVANRGEIAWRVLRACRELGVRAIAVYSEIDRDAPWLRLADDAYLLGPAKPSESYLNVERLLDVAERAGAEAVHPGYGFLSENADFARAVDDAGFVWVGPSPTAIVRMGDKLSARSAATTAGVPVVPGTMQQAQDAAYVAQFARQHGYPIAIKAAYGGGGRGMRVVYDDSQLEETLEAAQREAVASFGHGEVYLEKYLERPRHIEAQMLADTHGNILFLGERDCSTQRRHQKLIEEAPAPHFDEESRAALRESAVSICKQVRYVNAGTIEFLYEEGQHYFLEMNTRLQVEHPVTELVTGIDLVHWQLRVAAGEELPWSQDDIELRGHAIELRVNAERPADNFAPSAGTVTTFIPPQGPGVRVDAGVVSGWQVPPTYDSLVAKLISYGADREHARKVLVRACDEFEIVGVPTTLSFHQFAIDQDDFRDGRMSTITVEQEWDLSGLPADPPATQGDGARTPTRTYTVEVDGRAVQVALFDPTASEDGQQRKTRRSRSSGAMSAPSEADVVSPMQGTVVKVAAEVGEPVSAGDLVMVLEAMKMENQVAAHRDGVLSAVHAEAGAVVQQGDKLFTIDESDAAATDAAENSETADTADAAEASASSASSESSASS
jgi:acetyl-CoA/propionyl-CoA carboxylase biotin carboxyl carrier protein